MNKQELQKKYQEIIMETNGNMEDYSLAICRIGTAINELEDIKDLQQQLDQQKAMWNELKEFIIKKQEEYQAGIIEQGMQGSIPNSISFYVRYNLCNEIQKKIQELEAEDE